MGSGEREYYGSLLISGEDLPRDRHGFPYQVILLLMPGGDGTRDLKRDSRGRVLAWIRDEQGRPVRSQDGQLLMEPVPLDVQRKAEEWLAQQHDPAFEPTPWWEPGDHIICSDCGADLDPTVAVPRFSLKSVMPICGRCRDVRQELDSLLD